MTGMIELRINGNIAISKNVAGWKDVEHLHASFKGGFVKTLSDSDTWEIVLTIQGLTTKPKKRG